MGGLKWRLCYKKSRVLASARMPPLVANPWDVFFSRAGATLHNVTREWAFLKGVTSVNWKMTGWEDKRQKGRSMTPCDVAVSRLNTRPREKRRIHLHQIWQGVCFLKTAWGRKKAHKGSIWPECVFSTSVDAECFYNRLVACQNPPRHFFQP